MTDGRTWTMLVSKRLLAGVVLSASLLATGCSSISNCFQSCGILNPGGQPYALQAPAPVVTTPPPMSTSPPSALSSPPSAVMTPATAQPGQ